MPEAVRSVLARCGYSLAEIARQSRTRFSDNPLFRIPPNFYDELRRASFSPSLYQLFALSALTGYRLADWLWLFAFSFDDAARFQSSWQRRRTAELDAQVYDGSADVEWFKEPGSFEPGKEITPLGRWLAGRTRRSLDRLVPFPRRSFRYAKIGFGDAYAFPELLPGSIVRIDSRLSAEELLALGNSNRIVAIRHSDGVVCSRLRPVGGNRVVLCSGQLPYAPVELELGSEAAMLGAVDLEIRPVGAVRSPEVSPAAARVWVPEPLGNRARAGRLGERIRRARLLSGLSFDAASSRTREIAEALKEARYFCAPSALSDIEANDRFPRHVHKLISLSAVYCVPLSELARWGGLDFENAGTERMPERARHFPASGRLPETSRFLEAMLERFEEIPCFLRGALPALFALPQLSVRDIFWAGSTGTLGHPYLRNSLFLVVNRRSKRPATSLSSPVWAQPLYIVETRE
ncbi:MAG TPA: hypothetical protein VKB24_02295, partial [Candidatus Acidoferrum sp.]|nr:hypothetical protein [Candidatus Acidoferrum sp.]